MGGDGVITTPLGGGVSKWFTGTRCKEVMGGEGRRMQRLTGLFNVL